MKYEQSVQVELQEYICMVKRIDGVVAQKVLEQELIRCKDCKKRTRCMTVAEYYYCSMTGALTDETDYCSWAEERKEE